MRFLFLLVFVFAQSLIADESFKYLDQTSEHWTGKDEPLMSAGEMEIRLGGWKFADEKFRFTEATWRVDSVSGYSCKRYSIVFNVLDRSGKIITSEAKKFDYADRVGNADKYDSSASNILSSGRDHSAKFLKRFDNQKYLTIKYWLKDVVCEKNTAAKVSQDSDKIAFTLQSVIDANNKEKNDETIRAEKANAHLKLVFNRPDSAESFSFHEYRGYFVLPKDVPTTLFDESWSIALKSYCQLNANCNPDYIEEVMKIDSKQLLNCKKYPCIFLYTESLQYPNSISGSTQGSEVDPCHQYWNELKVKRCSKGGVFSKEKCTSMHTTCKRIIPKAFGGQIQSNSESLLMFFPSNEFDENTVLKYEFGEFQKSFEVPKK